MKIVNVVNIQIKPKILLSDRVGISTVMYFILNMTSIGQFMHFPDLFYHLISPQLYAHVIYLN